MVVWWSGFEGINVEQWGATKPDKRWGMRVLAYVANYVKLRAHLSAKSNSTYSALGRNERWL